jgi:pimeloyl-ACP methyl ester carboxylesterase
MARHDAWPLLGEITVPTLVVGGTRDLFLPARTVAATAAAIPGAELWLVDGSTHYLPVEVPAELDGRIERFLAERAPLQPT